MARKDLIDGLTNGDLKFFICTAPEEEVKKTSWISTKSENQLVIHNVKLKEECSGEEPHFILKSNEELFRFNYCYYYNTKRFYWIKEPPILLPQGQMEIKCLVDPVYSFMLEIGDCMGFEDRASNIGTGYVADDEIIFNASPQGEVHEFTLASGSQDFESQSYIVTVANALGFANHEYQPGDKPIHEGNATDYEYPQYTDGDEAIIQAIFDKIDEWRTAGWKYNNNTYPTTPNRDSEGNADCSSLIFRAMKEALNLNDDFLKLKSPYATPATTIDMASGFAYWFQIYHEYAYDYYNGYTGSPIENNNNSCGWHNAFDMRPGDLIFFIDPSRSDVHDRFPSCYENDPNTIYDDHSGFEFNKGFCMENYGTTEWNDTPINGIGHIAIVHDCMIDKYNTYTPLKGYKFGTGADVNKLVVDTNASAFTPTKDEVFGGVWVLECLPQKLRNDTVTIYDGKVRQIGANFGGVLYQRRNCEAKIVTNYQPGSEDMDVDMVQSFNWSDKTIALYIRPNYTKIVQDFQIQSE